MSVDNSHLCCSIHGFVRIMLARALRSSVSEKPRNEKSVRRLTGYSQRQNQCTVQQYSSCVPTRLMMCLEIHFDHFGTLAPTSIISNSHRAFIHNESGYACNTPSQTFHYALNYFDRESMAVVLRHWVQELIAARRSQLTQCQTFLKHQPPELRHMSNAFLGNASARA